MKTIHWGILGTGTIAKKFAASLSQLPDCGDVIAVASRSAAKAMQFAADYQIPEAYGSYESMVRESGIDVVYIATPHSCHYENVKLCLENGKNVLCEKAFTINAVQARALVELAKEKKLFLMEAFWTKFLPAYQKLQTVLQAGKIGDITHFRAQYGFAPTGERYKRKFDPLLAGGALLDIGVYTLGVAAMILGYKPKRIHSCGILGEFGTDRFDSIMLEYENGCSAHLIATIGIVIEQQAVIFGTEGQIVLPDFSALQRFEVLANEGERQVIEAPFDVNGFEYQIRETEHCLRERVFESPVMSHQDTIDIMELMDRVRSELGLVYAGE